MPDKEPCSSSPAPRKRNRQKIKIVPLTPEYDLEGAHADSPEDQLIKQERYQELHHALAKIPLSGRALLHLRYGFDGPPHTLRELARARGVTEEAVRQKIDRLLKRLRIYLKRRELREKHKAQTALSSPHTLRTK